MTTKVKKDGRGELEIFGYYKIVVLPVTWYNVFFSTVVKVT